MTHKFVNPTQKGKNILMLRYIIIFLFLCLFQFLWRPIWSEYFLGIPFCEQQYWNALYYICAVLFPFLIGLVLGFRVYQIKKHNQYPLPDALVFKPTPIVEGVNLKKRIRVHSGIIMTLFILSCFGIYLIQDKEIFKDTCEITLFN